jgi:hypothetical protein
MKTMLTKSSFILALVIILMSFDYPGEANEDATMIPSYCE